MSTKGQTINDRINAAKYTLAGQALARCICKATTEELMRPKKKHLDYLAACTYESNVSMLQLANMLIERTNHSNWAVVYKALITVHHLMSFGSERFTQYLASSNYSFQLSGFLDRIVAKGYAMSTFIRRYSNYINQKALSYRTLAVDLCRTQRKGHNILRSMPIERLLETLPVIQRQLDTLLDFGCTAEDLSNGIVTASFTLLFHDLIRLFASYNEGIINLFEKYFDLNKKMCREAFEAYKKFLSCTDRVADFLKVAEAINLDRGEIPDFKRAPSSLLDALEQHLISLESNKKRTDKLVIDTKLAALPSFAVNTSNFDYEQPQVATIAAELESSLSFSTDNNFDTINTTPTKPPTEGKISALDDVISVIPPPTPSVPPAAIDLSLASDFDVQLSAASIRDLKDDAVFGAGVSDGGVFGVQPVVEETSITNNNNNNIFDIRPPGYSGGSLLTPEPTLQINLDPSIDPHTQQQLIQIQREQAANKHKQGGNNSSSGVGGNSNNNFTKQNNNYSTGRSSGGQGGAKSKHESIFEDLELTMRQSLQKVEKT